MPGWIVTDRINTMKPIASRGYNQGTHVCSQIKRLINVSHNLIAPQPTTPARIDDVCTAHGSIENT